jgi:hypothetical protein
MVNQSADSTMRELVERLAGDVTRQARQELSLARSEMSQNTRKLGMDVAIIAAGGAVALAGSVEILAGVTQLVGTVMPRWLASFVMGGVLAGAGFYLIGTGRKALSVDAQATAGDIEADLATLRPARGNG